MLCSDLERYLEAYLDGRLGRSRTTILRRHLGMCGACRARVERLRRFEREISRQLGSGGAAQGAGEQPSVWQGLEVDLVRSFSVGGTDLIPLLRPLPPSSTPRLRPPSGRGQGRVARGATASAGSPSGLRRRLSGAAGVLAVALAMGAVYEFARAWLVPEEAGTAQAAAQAYADFAAGRQTLAWRTDDAASLENWFRTQLGGEAAPPVPPPPEGFRLVGGAKAALARRDAAVIAYAPAGAGDEAAARPTLLFVQAAIPPSAADDGRDAAAPEAFVVGGYTQLAWEDEPYSFRLVSAEPAASLHRFGPAAAGEQQLLLAPAR